MYEQTHRKKKKKILPLWCQNKELVSWLRAWGTKLTILMCCSLPHTHAATEVPAAHTTVSWGQGQPHYGHGSCLTTQRVCPDGRCPNACSAQHQKAIQMFFVHVFDLEIYFPLQSLFNDRIRFLPSNQPFTRLLHFPPRSSGAKALAFMSSCMQIHALSCVHCRASPRYGDDTEASCWGASVFRLIQQFHLVTVLPTYRTLPISELSRIFRSFRKKKKIKSTGICFLWCLNQNLQISEGCKIAGCFVKTRHSLSFM